MRGSIPPSFGPHARAGFSRTGNCRESPRMMRSRGNPRKRISEPSRYRLGVCARANQERTSPRGAFLLIAPPRDGIPSFRGSSAVEQPAVNRLVVGSNPTRGAICCRARASRACAPPSSPRPVLRCSEERNRAPAPTNALRLLADNHIHGTRRRTLSSIEPSRVARARRVSRALLAISRNIRSTRLQR
jgi:hypothetical protein